MKYSKYRNVIIFGASRGIGKALALEYASAKSNLILFSRNIDGFEELSKDISNLGCTLYFKKCDVSIKSEVKDAVEFAVNKFDTIDLAIINSGVGSPEWMVNFNSEDFKNIHKINVFGIAHGLEYLIPVMINQGYGTIAGVTSLADVRGYPGSAGYCSSKAAASVLLESARVELKKHNIRIITVRPGFVKTAMTDKNEFYMPFLMNTDKAAGKIMKGIEKNKSIVQFPFFTVNLTRLVKFLPNFIYDPLIRLGRKPV
jgi:short-subunit dehydrogenase